MYMQAFYFGENILLILKFQNFEEYLLFWTSNFARS